MCETISCRKRFLWLFVSSSVPVYNAQRYDAASPYVTNSYRTTVSVVWIFRRLVLGHYDSLPEMVNRSPATAVIITGSPGCLSYALPVGNMPVAIIGNWPCSSSCRTNSSGWCDALHLSCISECMFRGFLLGRRWIRWQDIRSCRNTIPAYSSSWDRCSYMRHTPPLVLFQYHIPFFH